MDLTLLLAQTAPSRMALLAAVALPSMVGLALFYFLNGREPSQLMYRLRLLSLLPVVGGVLYGGLLTWRISTDFLYQQVNLIGRGAQLLHYACLAVPLVCLILILVWNGKASQQQKYDF
jgi:hypothetical protein